MVELNLELVVVQIKELAVLSSDGEKEVDSLLARNADGDKGIVIKAPKGFFDGFQPDDVLSIKVKSSQTKLV